MTIRTLDHQIGYTVRALRGENSVTLDALATAMRGRGFEWSTGSVGNLEAGRMKVTIAIAIALADALSERTGRPIALADLLGDAEHVEISPRLRIKAAKVRDILNGSSAPILAGDLFGDPALRTRADEAWTRFQRYLSTSDDPALEMPLAVVRAARALGLSAVALQSRSMEIYGRSILEERDARAGEGASAQALGAAMRVLIKELRERYPHGEH